MKRNKLLFVFLMFVQFAFSQGVERQVLHGRIIADSLEVENITIFNFSSNIGAISDIDGKFSIRARVKDTLFFQGLSFVSQKYVLAEKDIRAEEFEVRLDVRVNELNEVIVTPSTLTGVLEIDTKKIKTYGFTGIDMNKTKYYGDERFNSPMKNSTFPNHFAPNGSNFDFIAIGKGIGNLLGIGRNKKKDENNSFEMRRLKDIQTKSFAEHMKQRFSHHFFVSTLKIENKDLVSFLAFSEMPSYELAIFLQAENELKLIEYLITKASEYKIQKEESLHLSNEKKK